MGCAARLGWLVPALLAAGCASTPPPAPAPKPAPAPPPASAPDRRAAAPAALATERQWLQSWFRDTPVTIAARGDTALAVEVPREFCFDPGRSTIKPALAAVLDKVAESLRRVPAARVTLVAAPADGAGGTPLALARAARVQEHLRSRGVAAARLAAPSAAAATAVQLSLALPEP